METDHLHLLQLPVEQLALSPDCISQLKEMGFKNLNEVTVRGWRGLREMQGFNYSWFNEVVRLLDSCQLVYLLEG